MNSIQSKIDTHPLTEQIKEYIYSQLCEGVGYRLIANGLHDLYDLKISHQGVKNWVGKNPIPIEVQNIAVQDIQDESSDIFDFELYEKILPSKATELQKMKAKFIVLAQRNIDRHIESNKRLNPEYLKMIKLLGEVQGYEDKEPVSEMDIAIRVITPEPDLSKLSSEQLEQLEEIVKVLGRDINGNIPPYGIDIDDDY